MWLICDRCYHFAWQDTEKCDTFFLTIEGQALDPRPAAASTGKTVDDRVERIGFQKAHRREKVAHIRFSEDEFSAVEAAAERAVMSVSAFVRSLSLEGAGEKPFLSSRRQGDHPAARSGHARRRQQPQPGRTRPQYRPVGRRLRSCARAIDDARAVATTVAAELAMMTKRAAAARRGEAG